MDDMEKTEMIWNTTIKQVIVMCF